MKGNADNNKKLVVAYFTSDLYAEPCGVSIASLFQNNMGMESISVFIVEDKISEANKNRLTELAKEYSRFIIFITSPDPQLYFSDRRFSIATLGHTYGRMIIGKILPCTVTKVLCLDCDMLIIDSLEELWNIDINEYYIAGVDSAVGSAMMQKTLKMTPGTLYCNGGLFLVNLELVRIDRIEDKYVDYIKAVFDKGEFLGAYEEEVINKCCFPKVLRLYPQYNLMSINLIMDYDLFVSFRGAVNYYSKDEMEEAIKKPVIIHAINTFYVKKRIWEKNTDSPYADSYLKFRKLTGWKDLPQIEVHRSAKQKLMKEIWHIMPKKTAFKLAAWVRNEIRPRLFKKRDDE